MRCSSNGEHEGKEINVGGVKGGKTMAKEVLEAETGSNESFVGAKWLAGCCRLFFLHREFTVLFTVLGDVDKTGITEPRDVSRSPSFFADLPLGLFKSMTFALVEEIGRVY